MTEKTLGRVYWAATLLFFVPQLYNAGQMLGGAPQITEMITALGYPHYFVKALAGAKLLGAVAIFYERARTLKEWAYAGYTFEVIAAFVSELATHGSPLVASVLLVFLGLLFVSYGCWKRLIAQAERQASESASSAPPPALSMEMAVTLERAKEASHEVLCHAELGQKSLQP